MSEQDVNTMRTAYEAFNRGDIPAVLEALHRQIEWHEPGGGRAPQGTFSGTESVANDVFAAVPENFDEFEAQPDSFIDAGEHIVVVGTFHGKSKAGRQLQARYAHVWRMRDGKAINFDNHVEAAPWAAGWNGG
jgi:ketosteroid isomerase-like protein